MNGKNILLISQYFTPDITAAAFRIEDLYNALKESGHNVKVITTYPQKTVLEEVEELDDIIRIAIKQVNKKNMLSYLLNFFGFMFASIYYSLFKIKNNKFDYIIVTSPPLFVALGGMIISKILRSKLIVDIRDIWPDSAVAAKMISSKSLFYKISKVLERQIYKSAYKITCVSKPMKMYIQNEIRNAHVEILYNGITDYDLKKEDDSNTSKEKDLNKNTIIYAGNIGSVQGLDIIYKVNKLLIKEGLDKSFEFILIGDGIERLALENKVKTEKMENITFTGPKLKKDVISSLEKADALFLNLKSDPTLEKTIPSKLFDYLINNRPIICGIKGEGKEILENLGCAVFFESNNPESLYKALLKFDEKKEALKKMSRNNFEYVNTNFNRTRLFRQFSEKL